MKDSKFIELLNLYVDHQISAEDAALLEAEIQRSPERRRIYREYCQMQKACIVLAETFRTEVPPETKVAEFPRESRPRLQIATYAMGALAAAACVALVLVERSRLNEAVGAQQNSVAVALPNAAATDVAVVVPVSPASVQSTRAELQPAFAGLVRDDGSVRTSLAASVPLDWMNRVQLQRVPVQELWFESRSETQPNELIFRSSQPAEAQTSMAAFRFQR